MNLTIKTLDQIHEAMDALEDARDDIFLNSTEKTKLETAALQLRNIERSIIKKQESELVAALADDSKALTALVADIKDSAERLNTIAGALEKAAKGVEALIQILITASSAGLL